MLRLAFLFAVASCLELQEASAEKAAAPDRKPARQAPGAVTLDSFIQRTLATGFPSRLPGLIAEQIGIVKEAPYYGLAISSVQATDSMYHSFRVIADSSDETKPIGLMFETSYSWPGNSESHWYRASLYGKIERAVVKHAKRDGQGRSIKGSGRTAEKDVDSPEIKQRFQHELDLWLKRTYLKDEWRSAEFFQGSLKKK